MTATTLPAPAAEGHLDDGAHPGEKAHPVAVVAHAMEERSVDGSYPHGADLDAEDGSLVTEYGLLAIVAATIVAGVVQWASDGAMSTLFNALLREARAIVGA